MVNWFESETLVSPQEPSSLTYFSLSPRGTHCFMGTNIGRGYFYSLATNPPLYAAAVNGPTSVCEIDWSTSILVAAGDTEEDGELGLYQFSIGNNSEVFKVISGISIGRGASCITFCHSRSEVYIGYNNGVIGVVALRLMTTTLICSQF